MKSETIKVTKAFEGFLSQSDSVHEILNTSLFEPISDLCSRPAKNFRATLVRAGYLFARESVPQSGVRICSLLSEALEAIHAGSLIIDDIQDSSRERRGSPSLHEKYGLPLALNAGNYLYFQPFAWIESLGLSERIELRIYRLFHEAMLNAHIGQALDLGTKMHLIERHDVEEICRNTSRLKTGSITSLALTCGAAAGGASDAVIDRLRTFGENLGVALQRFDDIGNLTLTEGDPKRFEDLNLKRPSWAWALAAGHRTTAQSAALSPTQSSGDLSVHYRSFVAAAHSLPDGEPLSLWLERENFLKFAQGENENFLNQTLAALKSDSSLANRKESLALLDVVCEKLRISYGSQKI
jgi:geranylgeranyl pyrophosphate synthase